jgi:hypothetical protein
MKLHGTSCLIWDETNWFRKKCRSIVVHKFFDNLILLLITLSTILLTIENPLDDPNGSKIKVLYYIDIVVTILFTLELLIKVVVYGFVVNGKFSYMRNSWNQIDFIIVAMSIISLIF